MKAIARSLVVIFVALIAVPALAVTQTVTFAVQLLATTALIMGGTQHPLSPDVDSNEFVSTYMGQAVDHYIDADGGAPVTNRVAVIYPAQFFPAFGTTTFDQSVSDGRGNLGSCLDNVATGCNRNPVSDPIPAGTSFVIFGYSQSAVVASLVKQDMIDGKIPGAPQNAEVDLLANPTRGNGGILARGFKGMTIPGLGITFSGAAPTNSCQATGPCYRTTDAAAEYDLLGGDAPAVPWNILAWINSGFAYALNHGALPTKTLNDDNVIHQGEYGDTNYYMFTADVLPMLQLLETAGVPKPILLVVDAPLREMVEWGYYRNVSPGQQLDFQLLPETDPITLLGNIGRSIPVGIDNGLEEAGVGRLLGTDGAWRPFGVGGQAYDRDTGEPIPDASLTDESLNAEAARVPEPHTVQPPAPTGDNDPEIKSAVVGAEQEDAAVETGQENAAVETGQENAAVDNEPETQEADDNSPVQTPPAGIKPNRFWEHLRDPIEFDRPKPPSALRPNGDGPLKRIVNALTGQKPKHETEGKPDSEPAQKAADEAA